jgi:hypothetical protein
VQSDRVPHDPGRDFVNAIGPQELLGRVCTIDLEPVVLAAVLCGERLYLIIRRVSRIAGHRIKVADVAIWYERMGMIADGIVLTWPSLTLSEVHAALAYYELVG